MRRADADKSAIAEDVRLIAFEMIRDGLTISAAAAELGVGAPALKRAVRDAGGVPSVVTGRASIRSGVEREDVWRLINARRYRLKKTGYRHRDLIGEIAERYRREQTLGQVAADLRIDEKFVERVVGAKFFGAEEADV